MEFIKNIVEIISALSLILGTIITIEKFTKGKLLLFLQKPVLEKIDKLDLNQCRNYLVEFMSDLENRRK